LKEKFFNYTLINAHSPTDVSDIDKKEEFFETLETAHNESPFYDIKIILDDLMPKQVNRNVTPLL
jgi:hypothetical protein